jgi:hypothetical protein
MRAEKEYCSVHTGIGNMLIDVMTVTQRTPNLGVARNTRQYSRTYIS